MMASKLRKTERSKTMLPCASFILSLAAVSFASPSLAESKAAHFPAPFIGSWANSLKDCEPEFTGGFTIASKTLSLYEGSGDLLGLGPVTSVRTPSGLGRSLTAKLRYQDEESPGKVTAVERLTVVGRWIYRSEARAPMATHLSIKNRSILCPAGSTG